MTLLSLFQEALSAGGSSKESSDAQKDDGVFKAPPPPPKVTKCVTVPTDLYQDQVTALKCRKEHKEVLHTRVETLQRRIPDFFKGFVIFSHETKWFMLSRVHVHPRSTSAHCLRPWRLSR